MNSIRYVSYGGADDPPKEEDKPPEFTDEDAKQEQDSSFSSMWVVDVPNVGAPTDINKDVAVQSLIDKYETSGKKGVVEKLSSVSVNAVKSSGTGLFNRIATGIRQGADNFQKFSRTMNEAAKYATGRGKYVGDILSEIRGKRRGLGSSSSGTSRTVRANVRNVRGRIVGTQGQKGKKTKKLIGKENQRCVTDNNCGDPINLFCYREIDNSSHGICKRRNCYIYKKPNYCGKTHLCLPKDPTMPFVRKTFGIGSDINAQQIRNKHLGEQPTREKSKATQDIVKYLIKLKNYKFQIQTKYNDIFEINSPNTGNDDSSYIIKQINSVGNTIININQVRTKDKYFRIKDAYQGYNDAEKYMITSDSIFKSDGITLYQTIKLKQGDTKNKILKCREAYLNKEYQLYINPDDILNHYIYKPTVKDTHYSAGSTKKHNSKKGGFRKYHTIKKTKLNSRSKKIHKKRKVFIGGNPKYRINKRLNRYISENNTSKYFQNSLYFGSRFLRLVTLSFLYIWMKDMAFTDFYYHHFFFAGLETEEIIYFSTYNKKKLIQKIKQIESKKYEKPWSVLRNFNLDVPTQYKVEILRSALIYNFDSQLKRNRNQPKNLINLGSSLVFLCLNYPTQGVREYLKDLELFYIRTTGESPEDFFTKIQAELYKNKEKYTQYRDTYTYLKNFQIYCLPQGQLSNNNGDYEKRVQELRNSMIYNLIPVDSKYEVLLKSNDDLDTTEGLEPKRINIKNDNDNDKTTIFKYKQKIKKFFEIFTEKPVQGSFFTEVIQMDELLRNINDYKDRKLQAFGDDEIFNIDNPDLQNFLKQQKHQFKKRDFDEITLLDTKITFGRNIFPGIVKTFLFNLFYIMASNQISVPQEALIMEKVNSNFSATLGMKGGTPAPSGNQPDPVYEALPASGTGGPLYDDLGNPIQQELDSTYDVGRPRQSPKHQYTEVQSPGEYMGLDRKRPTQVVPAAHHEGYMALNRKGFPTMTGKSGTVGTGTAASTNQPSQPSPEPDQYDFQPDQSGAYGVLGSKGNPKADPRAITKLTNKMTETGLRKGGFLAGLIDRQHNYTDFIGKYKVEFEKKYINEEEPYVAIFSFYKNYLKENFLRHKYFFNNICCFLEFLIKIEQVGILLFKLKKGEGNTKMSVINIATNDKLLQEIKQKFAKIPQNSIKKSNFNNNYKEFAKDCIIKGQNIPSIEDYLNFLNMYYEGGTVDSNFEQNTILGGKLTEIAKVFDTNTIKKVENFDGTENIEYQEFSKIFEKLEFDIQTRRIVKAFDKKYSTEFYDVLEHETYLKEEINDQKMINNFLSVSSININQSSEQKIIFEALSAESEYIRKKNIGMKGGGGGQTSGTTRNPHYEKHKLPSDLEGRGTVVSRFGNTQIDPWGPSSTDLSYNRFYEPMGPDSGGSGGTVPPYPEGLDFGLYADTAVSGPKAPFSLMNVPPFKPSVPAPTSGPTPTPGPALSPRLTTSPGRALSPLRTTTDQPNNNNSSLNITSPGITNGPTENQDNTLTSNSQISQKTRDLAQKGQLERGKCFPIYHNCDSFDEAVLHKGLQLVNEAGTRKNLLDSKEFFDFLKKFLGSDKSKLEGIIRDEKNKKINKTEAQVEEPTETGPNMRKQGKTGTKKKGAQSITGPENTGEQDTPRVENKTRGQGQANPGYEETRTEVNPTYQQSVNNPEPASSEGAITPGSENTPKLNRKRPQDLINNPTYGLPNNDTMKLMKNKLKPRSPKQSDSASIEPPNIDLLLEELKAVLNIRSALPDDPDGKQVKKAADQVFPLFQGKLDADAIDKLKDQAEKRASIYAGELPKSQSTSKSGTSNFQTLGQSRNPGSLENPVYGKLDADGKLVETTTPETQEEIDIPIQSIDIPYLTCSNGVYAQRVAEENMEEQIKKINNPASTRLNFNIFESKYNNPQEIYLTSFPGEEGLLEKTLKIKVPIIFYNKIKFDRGKITLTHSPLGKRLFNDSSRLYGNKDIKKGLALYEKVSKNILKIINANMTILFTIFNFDESIKVKYNLQEKLPIYQEKILNLLVKEDDIEEKLLALQGIKAKLDELINVEDEEESPDQYTLAKESLNEYNFMLLVTGLNDQRRFLIHHKTQEITELNQIIKDQIEALKSTFLKFTETVTGGGKLDFKKKQLFKLIDIDSDEDQEILLKFAEKDFLKKKMKSGNNEFSTDDCEKYTYYDAQEATLPESLNINKSMEDYGFIYYENAKKNIDKKDNFVNLVKKNLKTYRDWFEGINKGSKQYDKQPNINIKGNNTYLLLNKTENPNIYEIGYIYKDSTFQEDFIEYTKPGDKIKIDGEPKKLKLSYYQDGIKNEYYVYSLINNTANTKKIINDSNKPDITNVKFYDENDTETTPPDSIDFVNEYLLPNPDIKKITKYEGDNLSTDRNNLMPIGIYQDKYVDYILDYNCSNDTTSIGLDNTINEEDFRKPTIHKYLDRNKNSLEPTDFKLSENYSISEGKITYLRDYLKQGKFNINDIHLLLVEIEIPPTQGEDQDCPLFKTSLLEILCFDTQYKFKKYMYYHFEAFVKKVKEYLNNKPSEGEGQGEENKAKEAMVDEFLNLQSFKDNKDVKQELLNIILYFEKKNEEGGLSEVPEAIQEDRMDIYNFIYIYEKENNLPKTPSKSNTIIDKINNYIKQFIPDLLEEEDEIGFGPLLEPI